MSFVSFYIYLQEWPTKHHLKIETHLCPLLDLREQPSGIISPIVLIYFQIGARLNNDVYQ